MSASTATVPLVDRASDWLNPILVKETRQALKSRQFLATFLLMLVASWLISVFGIVLAGTGVEYRAIGGQFFYAYYVVLAIAIFVIVPFGAFRSLLAERDLHTWEVLSITTLKPKQIVWGKLASAIVQLFVYYSAITPFIAFANLLKGIDVPTIAIVLVASLFWSLILSMAALTISTFGTQRYWQVFLTLAVLGGLLVGLITSLSIVGSGMQFGFGVDEAGFWWIVAILSSYAIAISFLSLQIAIAQLTFDADNRSSGIRIAAAAIFWMSLGWLGVLYLASTMGGIPTLGPSEVDFMLMTLTTGAALYWFVVGLFATTEPDGLSRRVRRDLMRLGPFRVLAAPFLPGGTRGLVYVFAHLSALVVFVVLASTYFGSSKQSTYFYAAASWCYVVIYLGFGAALGRLARAVSGDFRAAHTRVITVLVLALASILPQALHILDRPGISTQRIYFISDPFSTLYFIAEGHWQSGVILIVLAAVALVAVVVNLRAMVAGLIDSVRAYVPLAPAVPRNLSAPAIVPLERAS